MQSAKELTKTLDAVEKQATGTHICFGDIVKALNHRGFGPLMLAPTLLAILPTGAIPGVPALCGVFIFLLTIQLVFGRKYPWIPARLYNFKISKAKYEHAMMKIKPVAKRIDSFTFRRLVLLTHPVVQRIIAALCAILAVMMVFLGFIPLLPMLIAIPIFFFALGLSARDGIFTSIGFGFLGVLAYFISTHISLLK